MGLEPKRPGQLVKVSPGRLRYSHRLRDRRRLGGPWAGGGGGRRNGGRCRPGTWHGFSSGGGIRRGCRRCRPGTGVTSAVAVEYGKGAGVAEAGVAADAVGVAAPTDVVGSIVEGEVSGVQATSKRSMAIDGSARSRPLHQFFPDFDLIMGLNT